MCWCAMSEPKPRHEPFSWMPEVHPVNAQEGIQYFRWARLLDHDGFFVVADSHQPSGSMYFCEADNSIFNIKGACPVCGKSIRPYRADMPAEPIPQASVAPRNTPG